MPRFKPYSYEQMLMIPVDLKSQLHPGTFEFALNEIVNQMDLSIRSVDRKKMRYRSKVGYYSAIERCIGSCCSPESISHVT